MHSLVLLSGSSHPKFTTSIGEMLDVQLGRVILSKFANNETNVEIKDSVRNMDVYIVQTGYQSDHFIELLIMIHACKIASASRVTAVIPCFPYTNQSGESHISFKKTELSLHQQEMVAKLEAGGDSYHTWTTRSGKLVANLLVMAGWQLCLYYVTKGADHIITMDLHEPQFVGFFRIPVDNLLSAPLIANYIIETVPKYKDAVIVSPDAGGTKRATLLANRLGSAFAVIHRKKRFDLTSYEGILVGDVADKHCIILDDLVDSASTIVDAGALLKEKGATHVCVISTHGVFSGKALSKIQSSSLDEVIVSSSMPQEYNLKICSKIKVFDVAPAFCEAIRRIHNGESLSLYFQ